MKNYLIYLAIGHEDYRNEALYSLLSFYKFHGTAGQIEVLVFTDNAAFFRKILPQNVIFREMDAAMVNQWKGERNYIYRLKTKVLQEVCATCRGNFLFVDTDTVFLKNVHPIFAAIESGQLFLDACEGRLIDNPGGIAKKTRQFIKKHPAFSIPSDAEPIRINEQFMAWNSGTIGFNNSIGPTFVAVEELIDELYTKSNAKVFVVEQIALSYYFQKIGLPKATEDFIHHYWDFKEFRPVLAAFLKHHRSKNLEELILLTDHIHPQRLAAGKRQYKKLSFLQKQWRKFSTGKKWQMPHYKLE